MRVGHAERESVIDVLQTAYADGRLDTEELDQRVHLAMTGKTRGDLEPLTRDLSPRLPHDAEETSEDKVLGALAHAAGMLTSFVGPLVLMLVSGPRSARVRAHAVEALNFQLTLLIFTIVTLGVGGVVFAVAWIASLVAGLAALTGGSFRYPLTLRLIK
ncbi:putative Tic20 family protein [Actinocorallia herbida]|uniref:Putative Tic20 family protein n=2 Tax=Actinocorallia herbida TaxID=58109 RepID=A0A3N1D7F9_9ACTN|nr:putative Tic20 family protein [Actinocorallia herbida]